MTAAARAHRLSVSSEALIVNAPDAAITVSYFFRWRPQGGPWGSQVRLTFELGGQSRWTGVQDAQPALSKKPERVRVEWRIELTATQPVTLTGEYNLAVN